MSEEFKSSPEFFDAKYRHDADPWNFAGSPYELERYDAILAALSPRRYGLAMEPGCSIGVLSRRLASVCNFVEASDFSRTASRKAQELCADVSNVRVSCVALADLGTSKEVDLLVLSEIGYYFKVEDWAEHARRLVEPLPAGATVLGCHWLGSSVDHSINGDDVHAVLEAEPLICRRYSERHKNFRLDRWTRV